MKPILFKTARQRITTYNIFCFFSVNSVFSVAN
jgi:hypothetical protein